MKTAAIVKGWFEKWESGAFQSLPLAPDFKHTSPFGTIEGKQAYLELVANNRDKFLGYQFILHDTLYEGDRACVRYTSTQGSDFSLEVSEWFYLKNGLIQEIVSYYHMGEIREERKLKEA